jgi:hypothetical protein
VFCTPRCAQQGPRRRWRWTGVHAQELAARNAVILALVARGLKVPAIEREIQPRYTVSREAIRQVISRARRAGTFASK